MVCRDPTPARDLGPGVEGLSHSARLQRASPDASGSERDLSWFDRRGRRLRALGGSNLYLELRLSPDDTQVAAKTYGPAAIWTIDAVRGVGVIAVQEGDPGAPLWSPDGSELYFQVNRGDGVFRPERRRPDTTAPPTLLLDTDENAYVEDVAPDGSHLLILSGLAGRARRTTA